jgi:hypothetical protein
MFSHAAGQKIWEGFGVLPIVRERSSFESAGLVTKLAGLLGNDVADGNTPKANEVIFPRANDYIFLISRHERYTSFMSTCPTPCQSLSEQ